MARVLLGDDSSSVLDCIKDYLEIWGNYDVEIFSTGEELVARAGNPNYDAVLSDFDYGSGRMNGLEVVATIREHNPDVPIYLVTGEPDAEKYASTQGLTGVIPKGEGLDKILEVLSSRIK